MSKTVSGGLTKRVEELEDAVLTTGVTSLKDARASAGTVARDHENPYQPADEPEPDAEEAEAEAAEN